MEKKEKSRSKRKPHHKRAAAFMFIGILMLVCFMNLIMKDKVFSEKEDRRLQQRPKASLKSMLSGQFMEEYEAYKLDQFAARDLWTWVKTGVSLLEGQRETNDVFQGKDRYLLEDIKLPDEDVLSEKLKLMGAYREAYPEITFYMILVPNAANVLSHRLPALAVTESQGDQFKEIKKELDEKFVWVDVQGILEKNKKKDIFYHTDSRWTTLGAKLAFEELQKGMNLSDAGSEPEDTSGGGSKDSAKEGKEKDVSKGSDLTAYAVTGNFNGNLSSLSGYESGYREPVYIYAGEDGEDSPEVVVEYVDENKKTATLYDRSKLEEKDKYKVFLGGDFSLIDIRTTVDSTDRLLLFKDSYANCMIPFLIPYYREIIVVDPQYYEGNIGQIMEENRITSVLFLYNGNTFMEEESISKALADYETE